MIRLDYVEIWKVENLLMKDRRLLAQERMCIGGERVKRRMESRMESRMERMKRLEGGVSP